MTKKIYNQFMMKKHMNSDLSNISNMATNFASAYFPMFLTVQLRPAGSFDFIGILASHFLSFRFSLFHPNKNFNLNSI